MQNLRKLWRQNDSVDAAAALPLTLIRLNMHLFGEPIIQEIGSSSPNTGPLFQPLWTGDLSFLAKLDRTDVDVTFYLWNTLTSIFYENKEFVRN